MLSKLRFTALFLILVAAAALAEIHVPDELKDWQQWVLKDNEHRACPFFFDRGVDQVDAFVCIWPGELRLTVGVSGGRFSQQWTVFGKEQWISLPGGMKYWPDQVTVNDQPVVVVAHNNLPSVKLTPGAWRIAGRFGWDERPAVLPVPPQSGIVSLGVDGKTVARPDVNRAGVFLGERQLKSRVRDSVRTVVHRLVVDDVPTRLVTRLQIDVSGSVREEIFGPLLPEGFVPLNIESPLPAKLGADGNLHIQVRPGRWTIVLIARGAGIEDSISRPPPASNLAKDEIWSYQSNDSLRATAVENLPPVDPSQVEVPEQWRLLPAFRMAADAIFSVIERSRGVVSATNDLALMRTMWLDFDGDGFIVKDRIAGTMRTHWRLDMSSPFALLSAREGGESLLVTQGSTAEQTGIELRQSQVEVESIARANTRHELPVTGWGTRFARVETRLNLPPGHKLLMAPGVDRSTGSWMSQWQLLDFFLVLIITIAVWRLFGKAAGSIALGALVLSFHESYAPSWLWLNLLMVIALMRVAPAGRLRQLVSGYQILSIAALVVVLVPFVAGQLRVAIYPQLELQAATPTVASGFSEMSANKRLDLDRRTRVQALSLSAPSINPESDDLAMDEIVVTGARSRRVFSRYAPNAIVQTGPGIPSWRWNTYSLSWNGPVDADQSMRLVVMPRWSVSLMRIAAVALLLMLAGVLATEVFNRKWTLPGGLQIGTRHSSHMLLAGLLTGLMLASPQAQAQYPDAELLQQLQQRLLEAPDCVPRCAEIVSADVEVGSSTIRMILAVHALEDVAIPLPGSIQGWRPEMVLVNGASGVRVLKTGNNLLWIRVVPGRHTITLQGAIPAVDSLEIPFPSPPRVVDINSDAWFVAGTRDKRLMSGSLQLTRLQSTSDGDGTVRWESSRFPMFALVERELELDLNWRVRTTVRRVAPAQGALTLDIPLLVGESVVSGDFTVLDDRILVAMNPQQQFVSWTSNLPLQSPLELRADDNASWQEVWRFVVGNIWNAEFDGLPESNTGNAADGVRVAVFHPRGGETLTLMATRPDASAGSSLAFDQVHLDVTEASRTRDVVLQLHYRSTRGSQHGVRIPAAAELTSVLIDGQLQTLRAEGGLLTLPILPGQHAITISWRETGGMGLLASTPHVELAAAASNINISVTKPRDRWLLATRGPVLGPAVLYWSELAALLVFALILGRVKLTPLKTRHWLLLGLGFSTFNWPVLGLVIVWLMLCGVREKSQLKLSWWRFNLVQIGIAGMTILALGSIVSALPAGLLGTPDMHVAGHRSYGAVLNWFADSSDSVLPSATLVTVPLWIYKTLILAWALWLSFALLKWLPWVWQCFSNNGLWRSRNSVAHEDAGPAQ
jgi:hypothetical protein